MKNPSWRRAGHTERQWIQTHEFRASFYMDSGNTETFFVMVGAVTFAGNGK